MSADAEDLEPDEIIRLEEDRVVILDQRRLPDEEVELECRSSADVVSAIREMAVRGAPAIGIAGAYGYALAVRIGEDPREAARALRGSRPTAVNLAWSIEQMETEEGDLSARAKEIHRQEVARCRQMGGRAAKLLSPRARVLTHCNTGGLATGGYGTALGAIRDAFARGLLDHVYVDETRPLLQGSRLTAYELERLRIPHTVIVDSAAGSLMARGEISHVLTGADRIAANGDTANKIGTYALAVLAQYHKIPFLIVAPTSTIDFATKSGAGIPIEERDALEITARFRARNPAFDVTPGGLITAIVTEQDVHEPPFQTSLSRAPEVEGEPARKPGRGVRDDSLPGCYRHSC